MPVILAFGKQLNGTYSAVKPWTYTSAINQGGWNTLKVYAKGPTMVFYINNIQVFSSSVFIVQNGRAGVMMYRGAEASETMKVNYATLGIPVLGSSQAFINGSEVFGETLSMYGPTGIPKVR